MELEGRNVSSVVYDLRGEESDPGYGDPYHEPMRVFDLQTFARRIMKSNIFGTKVASGPLAENQIQPTRTFLSSERHSNTTSEDLSEI